MMDDTREGADVRLPQPPTHCLELVFELLIDAILTIQIVKIRLHFRLPRRFHKHSESTAWLRGAVSVALALQIVRDLRSFVHVGGKNARRW